MTTLVQTIDSDHRTINEDFSSCQQSPQNAKSLVKKKNNLIGTGWINKIIEVNVANKTKNTSSLWHGERLNDSIELNRLMH